MNFGLTDTTLAAIREILARHPSVHKAFVFGSRALGRETVQSDVDIALAGEIDALEAEGIALELEELPVAVKFDLQVIADIHNPSLSEHIARAGQLLYLRSPVHSAASGSTALPLI